MEEKEVLVCLWLIGKLGWNFFNLSFDLFNTLINTFQQIALKDVSTIRQNHFSGNKLNSRILRKQITCTLGWPKKECYKRVYITLYMFEFCSWCIFLYFVQPRIKSQNFHEKSFSNVFIVGKFRYICCAHIFLVKR